MSNLKTGFHLRQDPMMLGYVLDYVGRCGNQYKACVGVEDKFMVMSDFDPYGKTDGIGLLHIEDLSQLQNLYTVVGGLLAKERSLPLDGQFEAQSKHLDDFRKIVFKQLKITE